MWTVSPDGKSINQDALPATLAYRFGGDDHGNGAALRHRIASPQKKGPRTFCQHAAIGIAAQLTIGAIAFGGQGLRRILTVKA